ncbi:MAG: hypothetical protein A2X36_14725 [Elusimicrobia bacterium GWA2_69_24]|nr:MAG: hypothetical protein A2X36_14725 [Elusimicrobia bacterium GWA2_69_24]
MLDELLDLGLPGTDQRDKIIPFGNMNVDFAFPLVHIDVVRFHILIVDGDDLIQPGSILHAPLMIFWRMRGKAPRLMYAYLALDFRIPDIQFGLLLIKRLLFFIQSGIIGIQPFRFRQHPLTFLRKPSSLGPQGCDESDIKVIHRGVHQKNFHVAMVLVIGQIIQKDIMA